jgi:hypothetical protein
VAGARLPRRKRISQSKASEAFSVVVDERTGGGYTAWSTDDDDLKVEGSTLRGVDEHGPSARSKDMPRVIFGWVRTVQV